MLQNTADVLDKTANLMTEAKKALNNPQNSDNKTRLTQVGLSIIFKNNNNNNNDIIIIIFDIK